MGGDFSLSIKDSVKIEALINLEVEIDSNPIQFIASQVLWDK